MPERKLYKIQFHLHIKIPSHIRDEARPLGLEADVVFTRNVESNAPPQMGMTFWDGDAGWFFSEPIVDMGYAIQLDMYVVRQVWSDDRIESLESLLWNIKYLMEHGWDENQFTKPFLDYLKHSKALKK